VGLESAVLLQDGDRIEEEYGVYNKKARSQSVKIGLVRNATFQAVAQVLKVMLLSEKKVLVTSFKFLMKSKRKSDRTVIQLVLDATAELMDHTMALIYHDLLDAK
jgi:hypothetical protein